MLRIIINYCFNVYVNSICSSIIFHWRLRRILFKAVGIHVPNNSAIHSGCLITGANIHIGENSYINKNCIVDCKNQHIFIGNNVGIGFGTMLLTTSHEYNNLKKRTGAVVAKPIYIADGVWICGGVIVCPGVTIKSGCVVASGSIVTKDTEENGLYAGNPAKLIKTI